MANNMQKFPIADLQYGEATNAGLYTVCKAIHPNGYMAVQLPPCTLAFDAVDPNSRFAPKLKLKVGNSEQIAWLRAMDDKAKAALADELEKYPFKATVNEGLIGALTKMGYSHSPLHSLSCSSISRRHLRCSCRVYGAIQQVDAPVGAGAVRRRRRGHALRRGLHPAKTTSTPQAPSRSSPVGIVAVPASRGGAAWLLLRGKLISISLPHQHASVQQQQKRLFS